MSSIDWDNGYSRIKQPIIFKDDPVGATPLFPDNLCNGSIILADNPGDHVIVFLTWSRRNSTNAIRFEMKKTLPFGIPTPKVTRSLNVGGFFSGIHNLPKFLCVITGQLLRANTINGTFVRNAGNMNQIKVKNRRKCDLLSHMPTWTQGWRRTFWLASKRFTIWMLSTVMYVQPANILVREEGNKEISKDGEIIADGDEERESKVSDEMKAVCEMLHYIKIGCTPSGHLGGEISTCQVPPLEVWWEWGLDQMCELWTNNAQSTVVYSRNI